MRISLIITTYNWKEALHLSLQSALAQTVLPTDIIVADDGSREDTAEMVRQFTEISPVPIIHSWQEDKGFRPAKSRNKAIAKAKGEYVVLIDGDIVLDSHFIADHQTFSRRGSFVQGSRALVGRALSVKALADGELRVPFGGRGIGNKKNCLRLELLARLLFFKNKTLRGVKTCNFAFWKEDAVQVNGFNEAFVGWGREDSEFAARLLNVGLQRRNLKFCALGYHLHHAMHGRDRLTVNDCILQQTLDEHRTWCEKGINQYLD
jgi:GT2 family glycosyltransferase